MGAEKHGYNKGVDFEEIRRQLEIAYNLENNNYEIQDGKVYDPNNENFGFLQELKTVEEIKEELLVDGDKETVSTAVIGKTIYVMDNGVVIGVTNVEVYRQDYIDFVSNSSNNIG